MADKIEKLSSKLKEQSEQLKIALESVPTEEIAKDLIMDKLRDAYLIKIKASIENKLGLIMVLISRYNYKILAVYALAGTARTLNKTNPYEGYKRIIQDLLDVSTEEGLISGLSESLGRAVYYAFPENNMLELSLLWEKKDIQSTLEILKLNIVKLTNNPIISLEGDIEEISSVKVRYNSPLNGNVKPIDRPQEEIPVEDQQTTTTSNITAKKPYEVYLESILNNYNRIMNVKTIISPSDGAEFESLVSDEIIYFKPSMKTEEDKQLLQEFDLILPGGKVDNVEGRFLKLIDGEFDHHIFAVGPENILLHSVDTNRVKVQVKNKRSQKISNDKIKKESGFDMIYLIAGAIILGIILFLFLR
jgi:hypothetical protein